MLNKLLTWYRRPTTATPLWLYCLLTAILLTAGYNIGFVRAVAATFPEGNRLFVAKVVLLLLLFHWFFISLFSFNRLTKWIAVVLVMTAAIAVYFQSQYGIVIDKSMLQNVVETDVAEVSGLLSLRFFLQVFLFGVVPGALLLALPLKKQRGLKLVGAWAGRAMLPLVLICLTVFLSYKDFSSYFRNHQHAKHLAAPMNVVMSASALTRESIKRWRSNHFDDLTLNTHQLAHAGMKPRLLVVVVGETARADHFGVNGYPRNTTPFLSQRDILSFYSVSSCGTATAVSVPCMFSWLPRKDYDDITAKHSSNLLDFVAKAGVNVLWRDNNSGCKGMCDRVPTESAGDELQDANLCKGFYCNDDILLENFSDTIAEMPSGDKLVVLHQLGSHGPEYYKRSVKAEKQFLPECTSNELQDCSTTEITNAYDNSIIATDIFLEHTIETLETLQQQYDTAMVYLSDHGESLGENGLYLHGMPYIFAPEAQTHVPMIMWMSDVFRTDEGINESCLHRQTQAQLSHDNFFHTMLGIFEIEDEHYNNAMDIIAPCKNNNSNLFTAG